MPLKGASIPCSFPWEKAAQTWTSLLGAGGGGEGKAKQRAGSLQPVPRGCGGEQGVMEGQTAQGPAGLMPWLLQLCELLSAGSEGGREEGPAGKVVVGGEAVHKPFFISAPNSFYFYSV